MHGGNRAQRMWEICNRWLRHSSVFEWFNHGSDMPITPRCLAVDTSKPCCFLPSSPSKWGELSVLPKHFLLFLQDHAVFVMHNCSKPPLFFFWEGAWGICREQTASLLSAPQMLLWEILAFLCNFYKYTAKKKGRFGNVLTVWLSCFQFKPRVKSRTGDHIKT